MLSTDILMLDPASAVFARTRAYAERFGELDVIVFTTGKHAPYVSDRLRIHPTDSLSKLLCGSDAHRIAHTIGAEVVTAQDPFETGLAARRIAREKGVPLHIQIHTDFRSTRFALLSFKNFIRARVALRVLREARRIRVVSERIRDSLASLKLAAPVTVLPIFVDLDRIRSARGSGMDAYARFSTKLLVVSRLEKEKNVGLAIRAFAQAAPQDACLVIVGDGREREALGRLAERLGIAGRVFFEGRKDSTNYYGGADLVLFPSKYDGYGMVIIEALAAGKPVIATDVGIAREAGAIIPSERDFAADLKRWFEGGPRTAVLRSYPYHSMEEYVRAYCEDVAATAA